MTNTLTHRRNNPELATHVMLFAEANNEHYGAHVWTLVSDLPSIPEDLVELAAEHYGVTADEIRDEVDPTDIVNTAGVWDDPEFCYLAWDTFGAAGYRTQDGAVVLDREEVELTYHCEEE